jgi:hypothetical protein
VSEHQREQRSGAVFISYARPDIDFAGVIGRLLRDHDFSVLDDRSVSVGASFAGQLHDEISKADFFVVLMSPEYFSSRWCQAELVSAMQEEKPVVPVRMRGEPEGPLALLQHIDAETSSPPQVVERIVRALRRAS